jgi:hypothetical protein
MADRFQDPKVWTFYLEKDDQTLTSDEALKTAIPLVGKQEGGAPKHKCLDIIEYQMKVRLDLRETPFQTRFHFIVDGSLGNWRKKA